MALEHHSSSAQAHQCRLLQLSDNLVSALAFDKGRSKSWALNAMCRRACALTIAADIVWRLRHIRSEGNVSDRGSRREILRSPLASLGERLLRHQRSLVLPAPAARSIRQILFRSCRRTRRRCPRLRSSWASRSQNLGRLPRHSGKPTMPRFRRPRSLLEWRRLCRSRQFQPGRRCAFLLSRPLAPVPCRPLSRGPDLSPV